MAVLDPQFDKRPGLSGGADAWDDGLAGQLMTVDYFESITVSSYTINPSGNISFVGTISISLQKNVTITPSGSVLLSGTAPILFGNGSSSVTIFPTGNITFSGDVSFVQGKVLISSGTISFSQGTTLVLSRTMSPSGQLVFTGTSLFVKSKILPSTGTITFTGTAPLIFNGQVVQTTPTKLPLTFAGTT